MPSKKTKNVVQFEQGCVFPPHREIEENLQRRLRFWEDPDRKGPYPLPVLDFLVNAIGCELETGQDDEEFGKDTEFYNPSWYTTGNTNGELFYSVYKTILRMAEDPEFEFSGLPICDQEALCSILDLSTSLFLDRRKESGFAEDSIDLWILYFWTRKMRGFDIWQTDDGETVEPPPLGDLKSDDWEMIAEDVKTHFSEDEDDEFLNIALLDVQLHWPTFQEFRSAKAHLLNGTVGRESIHSRRKIEAAEFKEKGSALYAKK
jgi:hypothetical protein